MAGAVELTLAEYVAQDYLGWVRVPLPCRTALNHTLLKHSATIAYRRWITHQLTGEPLRILVRRFRSRSSP